MKRLVFFVLFHVLVELAGAARIWENGPSCPAPHFPNGRFRGRSRGRIIRYSCYDGYILVGNKYSNCVRGRWDTPIPVCVNNQCPPVTTPNYGLVVSKYNGAILMFFCIPGYVLVGPTEIYCNGRGWNTTQPYCRDSSAAAPLSCDFEKPDLCWWEQDPTHDFDWQRHKLDTPSSHIGTGPSYDHTLGRGYEGHYLYIEASGRLVNDTARIMSPLYNATLTENGCFSFWYHMFGATMGALKVYFKPQNSVSVQVFSVQGSQGNRWHHGYFRLPISNTSFQIVIEGVRGSSYVSDMAVDDVAILQGDQCEFSKYTTVADPVPTNDDQIELVNSLQTCRGRCGSGPASPDAPTTIIPLDSPGACHCHLDCAETAVCCPDFAEYCVLGVPDASTGSDMGFDVTEPASVSTVATRLPNRTDSHPPKPIPINPKDDIDPYAKATDSTTTRREFVTTKTRTKETTPVTTTTARTTSKTIVTKATKTTITTRTTEPTKPTKNTRTTQAIKRSTTVHVETPFPTLTATTWGDTQLSSRTEAHIQAEQATIEHLDHPMSLGASGIAAIVVAIASAIVLTTTVAYLVRRKRKSYKRGAGGSGSALSEDSDVRYLTSDEILDFNIARPTEYDE